MTDRIVPNWRTRLRRLIGRAAGRPDLPDWTSFDSYYELARAANKAHRLDPEAFLAGPLQRFLELCSDGAVPPRARARAMEFGRHTWQRYREQRPPAERTSLDQQAHAYAANHFLRPEVPDGDYMLEVFEGISTHNYRGKPDEEET